MPNVMALQGIGYLFKDSGPIIGKDPEDYIKLIAKLAHAVLDERFSRTASPAYRTTPPQPDVYVTAPSLYDHIYEEGINGQAGPHKRVLRSLVQMMQRQTGYQLRGSGKAWAQALIMMRRGETQIQVAAAGLAAAGTLSATVRVPPAVNRARGTIRQLANHARSDKGQHITKLVKTFGETQKRLADAVGPELIEVIDRAVTGVKLVADAPLEWLPVGNLPLALCKDVARITTTPGNLQIILLARSELLHLAVEAFCEVLIVTAFDLKDPIANVLPRALASWREMYEGRLAVRIVQAQSRSEFIDVLKSFEGAVMIFDGHGHHDRTTGLGTLRVGRGRNRDPDPGALGQRAALLGSGAQEASRLQARRRSAGAQARSGAPCHVEDRKELRSQPPARCRVTAGAMA